MVSLVFVPISAIQLKNGRHIDLCSEAMEVADALMMCSKTITPSMWLVWAELYKAVKTDSITFIEGMQLISFFDFGRLF